jgi:RHH-type proline utilization regulon transcriptional repressor/proline dehydrogenase/delta 1-pyrroline-5-carboxylate dehydrogenase
MHWSMDSKRFKDPLLRLVDVLPALTDRQAVIEHLKEYLGHQAAQAGERPWRHWDMVVAALLGSASSLRGSASAAAVRIAVARVAGQFIAGGTADQAVQAVVALRRRHQAFSLDLVGEKVLSEVEADAYAQAYADLIELLSASAANWPVDGLIDLAETRPMPRVNLSIKLTALYSQFDPGAPRRTIDGVLGRLSPLARLARQHGVFLHLDMEHHEVKDLTLDIFERLAGEDEFAGWRDIGVVLQSYLRDSPADLERLIELGRRRGAPFCVRLVKGAYWDYENIVAAQRGWPVPVFIGKCRTDANFERLTERLLEASDLLDPAIASHNIRSLAHALVVQEALDLPLGQVEYQMLYGMGDPIKAALVERGRRVRVYVPFGELIPGMAYLIRRLMENTANVSFLRQGFIEHADAEQLLADPAEAASEYVAPRFAGRTHRRAGPSSARSTGAGLPPLPTGSQQPAASQAGRPFVNCPNTDFSRQEARMNMHEAIEKTRAELGREYMLVIGAAKTPGEKVAERENPARPSQAVARVHWAGRAQADLAVQAARAAQPDWERQTAAGRAGYLVRLAEIIEANRHRLAAWEVFETAKPWREADADVSEAIDYCRYYAGQAVELMTGGRCRDVPGETNLYRYLPRGVGVVIAPWNFPLAILAGMSTAALAAGNTVIMKPAEQSSAVAGEFMAMIGSAALPAGVVNYLPGQGEDIGDYLVRHQGIDFVAFTGSRQVGLAIYAAAAGSPDLGGPKHVVCEMGGKNAIIVDTDADLDEAVGGVIESAFGYSGQKCSACSRVIAVGDVHARLLDRLVEAARSLTIGPPEGGEYFMGPLIDAAAAEKVRSYIRLGHTEARCVLETDVAALGEGHWLGPTIFADVPPTSRIAQEEIFGPVLAVMRAGDLAEALTIANGTGFALTGGIYSRSARNIERAGAEFRVGNLYINRKVTGALVDRQPFGGFRFSGLGSKAGGPDYLLQFVVPQTVTENTARHGFTPQAE